MTPGKAATAPRPSRTAKTSRPSKTARPATRESDAAARQRARRGEGDRLRVEILDAALELLAESGDMASLSLRSVARQVGVAATSIYLHFPDLQALQVEVKTLLLDRLAETLQRAADETPGDPYDRLLALAQAYVRTGFDEPGLYHVMFSAPAVQAHGRTPFLGVEAFALVHKDIAAIVGERTADLVTVHVWTALHGLVTLRTTRAHFPWPDLDVEVEDLVRRLTASPEAPAEPAARGTRARTAAKAPRKRSTSRARSRGVRPT